MSNTVAVRSIGAPRMSLENLSPRMAKLDLKKVEEQGRREYGAIVARTVELAGLTQKEAAGRMGIDPAQLARWIAGTENPQDWRIHRDELMGPALIAAQAEVTDGATVRTVIELRRKVG